MAECFITTWSIQSKSDTEIFTIQKQPRRSGPRNKCSEYMKQIYRRKPMPKCNAKQPYWNHTSAWVFSVKFATYFQNTFPGNISGWLLLTIWFLEYQRCFRDFWKHLSWRTLQCNVVHIPTFWITIVQTLKVYFAAGLKQIKQNMFK